MDDYEIKILRDILYELKEIKILLEGTTNKSSVDDMVSLILINPGNEPGQVIKVIRQINNMGLIEAKDMVDYPPSTIVSNINKRRAGIYVNQLESLGAKVEIRWFKADYCDERKAYFQFYKEFQSISEDKLYFFFNSALSVGPLDWQMFIYTWLSELEGYDYLMLDEDAEYKNILRENIEVEEKMNEV